MKAGSDSRAEGRKLVVAWYAYGLRGINKKAILTFLYITLPIGQTLSLSSPGYTVPVHSKAEIVPDHYITIFFY